jgi:hypothetical protein
VKRILITGSRDWTDVDTIRQALVDVWAEFHEPYPDAEITLVHGGATGADTIAGAIATDFGWDVEVWPADWERFKRAAGPIRNNHMVSLGADVCLAFPLPTSRGTIHCMKAAERAGIPVRVYEGERT